tara:strand:- start:165 stop:548 length:384 start_codon:yes stop_codon:yes gene_type:complete
MSDYTIAELQSMLSDKEAELAFSQSVVPVIETYEHSIRSAGDLESQKFTVSNNGVNLTVGYNIKSSSENKQMNIQKYHIIETTPDGNFICHALMGKNVYTGSYSDSLSEPTLQITETRIKDTKILRG